jgi:hypothetical protein
LFGTGLGVRVNNAVLKTLEDGTAQDVFWVTDLNGRKVSNKAACRHQLGLQQQSQIFQSSCYGYDRLCTGLHAAGPGKNLKACLHYMGELLAAECLLVTEVCFGAVAMLGLNLFL